MKSYYFRTFSFIKPYWLWMFYSAILIILFAASNVFFIPLVRDVSREISRHHISYFSWQMVNMIVLWSVRVVAQFGQTYVMSKVSYLVMLDIQQMIYRKLHEFSQHFYSHWKLGELLVRVFSDSQKLRQAIMVTFSKLVPQMISLVGVLAYLFVMNWKLTMFAMISIPFFVITMTYFAAILKRLASQIQKKTSNITHLVQESVINMKLVQAYTMEKESTGRFYRDNQKNFQYQLKSIRLNETKKAIELFMQGAVFISLLFFGGRLVATNELSGPELLSFFTGCILLIDPILVLSSSYTSIQQSLVSAERIYELLDEPVLILSPKDGISKDFEGRIELKSVSFQYDKSLPMVLDKVNLSVKQGETLALVGMSGSGKSTLVNLVARFYDAVEGEVLIDEISVKSYDLNKLRQQIAMVLQDDILFSGTVLENIRYGSPDATEAEIIQAAKDANAWEFIRDLPDKLLTQVGDQGRRLSGGQKQRISIARAFLRNARILILDEATSALDSKSEQLIKEALVRLTKGRTSFIIAHRLSTVRHADIIVVLDKGVIVEQGTHDVLLENKGHYASLYEMQFR